MAFDTKNKKYLRKKMVPYRKFWFVDFQVGRQVSKVLKHFPLTKNRYHVMMGVTFAADTHFKEQVPLDV